VYLFDQANYTIIDICDRYVIDGSVVVNITSAKGSLSDEIIGLVKEPPPLPTPPPCDGDLTYSEVINYKNKRFRGKNGLSTRKLRYCRSYKALYLYHGNIRTCL
jgi:hypothetical protein